MPIPDSQVQTLMKTQRLMGDVLKEISDEGRARDDDMRAAACEMLRCSIEAMTVAWGRETTAKMLYMFADETVAPSTSGEPR